MITGTKRTEYVVNTQPELSQVLQSTVTIGNKTETTYYFYGKGLIAQDNSTNGYLTYHFNNVGSTIAVTDKVGKVKYSYNYSPYGELLEGEYSDTIPFLFNGQFGVTTDANGLYYMRARYYNVDIKRFVNQDVLTGTLERISSLNRYSYVEGNPVSYLDPFGMETSIYDEWHDVTTIILEVMTAESLATSFLNKINIWLGVSELWVYCFDLGLAIGKAWEGIFENDYKKVDSSYQMMGEILSGMALTLSNIALSTLTGTNAFGLVSDLCNTLKSLSDMFLKP